ncbi:MAG: GDSL-type esterase/lipase family protein [Acidimicrobiales bacterium]
MIKGRPGLHRPRHRSRHRHRAKGSPPTAGWTAAPTAGWTAAPTAVLIAVLAAVLAAGLVLVPALASPGATLGARRGPAGARPLPVAAGGASPAPTYYFAIGASESVGVQPTAEHPRGVRTDHGYANDLAAIERHRWPGLRLVALGCPGISAVAAAGGGGACHYPAGSELATALRFLHHHRSSTVLATVDLGFNDLWPCLVRQRVDDRCVASALDVVGKAVSRILDRLVAAGGRRLRIVGVEHNDPYLGDYLAGRRGRAFAMASMGAIRRLNATLAAAYARAGVLPADVPAAFGTGNRRLVDYRDEDGVPTDVVRMCSMSWMCARRPFRHNIHPNTRGYEAMADALAAALAAPGAGPGAGPG